eukprot:1158799-Pelagomonas_calceolata.AAC.4
MSELLNLLWGGVDQPQADQPGSLAEGLPLLTRVGMAPKASESIPKAAPAHLMSNKTSKTRVQALPIPL